MRLRLGTLSTLSIALFWAASAFATDSIFELLDHHRVPSGVRVPAVQKDYDLGDDPFNANCAVRALRVHFYSPEDRGLAHADFGYLMPKGARNVPVVMILPNTHGATAVEGDIAGALCRSGFAVTFPDGKRGFPDDMSETNAYLRTEVIIVRTLLDFISREPEIDENKVGVAGVSYGALVTASLIGVDNRIKAAMILGGGADLPLILATSDNDVVTQFRNQEMRKHHLATAADYQAALRKIITVDGSNPELNLRSKSGQVLQYIIEGDKTVPESTQRQLWELLGKPKMIELQGGAFGSPHVSAIVSVVRKRLDEVVGFFESQLLR